jgi:hypothetical protein
MLLVGFRLMFQQFMASVTGVRRRYDQALAGAGGIIPGQTLD